MKIVKLIVVVFVCFFTASASAEVSNLRVDYEANEGDSNPVSRYPDIIVYADASNYNDVLATITAPNGTITRLFTKPEGGAVNLDGSSDAFDVEKPDIYFRGSSKLPGKYTVNVCQDGSCTTKSVMAYRVILNSYISNRYVDYQDKNQGAIATLGMHVFFGYDIPSAVTIKLQIGREIHSFSGTVSPRPKSDYYSHEVNFQLTNGDVADIFGTTADYPISATVSVLDGGKTVSRRVDVSMGTPY